LERVTKLVAVIFGALVTVLRLFLLICREVNKSERGKVMNIRKEIAAATAVVNYDLIGDEINRMAPQARTLEGLALTGSTDAGDCVVEIMVGNKSVGKFENTSTGLAVDMSKDFKKVDEFIPANAQIQAFVRDAANTNPILLYMQFGRPTGRSSFRRRTWSTKARTTFRRPAGMY